MQSLVGLGNSLVEGLALSLSNGQLKSGRLAGTVGTLKQVVSKVFGGEKKGKKR